MRILIVRTSAMGDIIHAMPAVSALRRLWPNALIGWAIEERWAPLLTSRPRELAAHPFRGREQPLVDVVHFVNLKRWRSSPFSSTTRRELAALRRELRSQSYDAAVDLQGAIRSAVLAKMSRAHQRVGEARPREYPARWWFTEKVVTYGRHVIEQDCEVVSALAGQPLSLSLTEFPRSSEAERWAIELVPDSAPYAILNPGAGWGAKCWPAERYGSVAHTLSRNGMKVLVNVGPGESDLGAQVVHTSGGVAKAVECSLQQLIALTRGAALFIGGDTGPMHLASAMHVPVVGIFGPTDPQRNGPLNTPNIVLRRPESKRDHTRRSEPEGGLLTITVEEVAEAASRLLAIGSESR
jgi:heptosyltransferase-1